MLFENNISKHLSLDETSLSKGELYTYLTNKEGKEKKGTLTACIKGTKSFNISNLLTQIPLEKRLEIEEVTLDLVRNMKVIAKASFPNVKIVTDRFPVIKLVLDELQHLRIQLRWEAIEKEKDWIDNQATRATIYMISILN